MKALKLYPLTTLCVALVFVLSLFTPPKTSLDDVAMIDKWTHLVMYGGTAGMFRLESWWHRIHLSRRIIIWVGVIAPIVLGGVIELIQAYCTGGRRSGEWADWVADALGVLIAWALSAWWFAGVRK